MCPRSVPVGGWCPGSEPSAVGSPWGVGGRGPRPPSFCCRSDLAPLVLQCMVSLHGEIGLCWCVYPWNGQKIVGSTEVFGDPNCDQYFPKADAS